MNGTERKQAPTAAALDGYFSGADAQLGATEAALALACSAHRVVLVEGISDQIAIDAAADGTGRDLLAEGTVIVPIGGAHAMPRFLQRFGPQGDDLVVRGLCDAAEVDVVLRALTTAGLGAPSDRTSMGELGFFVCDSDLEAELIRACGRDTIEAVLAAQGDLASFHTLQKQSAWRGRRFDDQVHRWLRAGARRNLRYARLLVEELEPERVPDPLRSLLAATLD